MKIKSLTARLTRSLALRAALCAALGTLPAFACDGTASAAAGAADTSRSAPQSTARDRVFARFNRMPS